MLPAPSPMSVSYTHLDVYKRQENDSVGRQIYKHLMNGVSHMLPFVIGGGILIALAFLLDDYSIDPSNFGKNTPLAAYLKTIGEQAFGMMPVSYTHLDVYKRQDHYCR